jgi:hypothetical protein
MKIKRYFLVSLAPALTLALAWASFFAPPICAQDFSKYRDFSLGMALGPLLKQVDAKPEDARVIHPSPRLIQELTWWPMRSYQSPAPSQPLDDVVFSFLDGRLYKIAATYDDSATRGLTDEDMIQTFSGKYGLATRPDAGATPASLSYGNAEIPLAHWEDAQYSVTLSRSAYGRAFDLLIFSKPVKDEADAAAAEAVKQEHENAPKIELARVKKESDDLETVRQANLKSFRP